MINLTLPFRQIRLTDEYDEQHVIDLPKNIFEIDGKFDSERIKEGNIVPLMTGDGQRVNASVVEIKPDDCSS